MTGFGSDPIPGLAAATAGDPLAPPPGSVGLRVLNGPKSGAVLRVEAPRAVLGRSDPPAVSADIDLAACEVGSTPMISRLHAEIRWESGEIQIAALRDRNGTFVNGVRLIHLSPDEPSGFVPLQIGDRLTLADLELEVVADVAARGTGHGA